MRLLYHTIVADKSLKTKEQERIHVEVVRQMLTLATSGFGLVAALAWNSLIQELLETYIKTWLPGGGKIYSLLIYALIVTILAVFVTLQLSKLLRRLEEESKS